MSKIPAYKAIQGTYRSGHATLREQFFEPCFKECVSYSRAAGFFTSTSLRAWASALVRLPADGVTVRLMIGPALSEEDSMVIRESNASLRARSFQQLADEFLDRAIRFSDGDDDERLWVFGALLKSGALKIKFAFTESGEGIYHEKIGFFEFPNGDWVAFDGSANESDYGHSRNFERIQVFRSWEVADKSRGEIVISDFEAAWQGGAPGLSVLDPSPIVLDRIIERSINVPKRMKGAALQTGRWEHQELAINAFLAAKRGILEMATGTGKTRTALRIARSLIDQGIIDRLVITMTGTDLLNQWHRELSEWGRLNGIDWPVLRHYERYKEIEIFDTLGPFSILLVSRTALHKIRPIVERGKMGSALIIHDEVHGLGAPNSRLQLTGLHNGFAYVLGLSATPEREYDEEGTRFIESEIGGVVFKFGLEDAIRKGILTELDYVPLPYHLSPDERAKISKYFSMKSSEDGQGLTQEDIWRMIAAVYKSAESKLSQFEEYLGTNPDILKRCIIFVSDTDYGRRVMEIIHQFGHNYKGYFAGEDEKYLMDFARGRISTLVTCHRVSQGIDIKDVQSIVLFSSDRAKLETIQRLGRCLRLDPENPGKRAKVIDFIYEPEDDSSKSRAADDERRDWMIKISEIKNNG